MAEKKPVELEELVTCMKQEAETRGALSGEISFTTQDGWRVSIKVTRLSNY